LLREEQRRQQDKRRRESARSGSRGGIVPGDELNEDNTVPVSPLIDGAPRQGCGWTSRSEFFLVRASATHYWVLADTPQ
jgi:hypothetical protein